MHRSEQQNNRLQVLIVDDNPGDRLLYRLALERGCFVIEEAVAGKPGIEFCRRQRPDCILLDYNMPGMNGVEFLAALKEEFGYLPCAVVMLTGAQDERVAVRAMKAGATDYIPKSTWMGESLERSVEGAIEKFRMRRQIELQQTALESSERKYRAVIEGTPHLVWVADRYGSLVYANRRWSDYTGLNTEETGGAGLNEVIFVEDREPYGNLWRQGVESGLEFECELRLRRALDGQYRWHAIRVVRLQEFPQVGAEWLGTCTDIEDNKLAQQALLQTQKWESIGLLAGGIAHDFNNLLVGILGGASLIVDGLPADHPLQAVADGIVQSGERAAQLTGQMLAYSGKGQFFVQSLELSKSVRETCDLIRSSIPANVRLNIETGDALPPIDADAGQIQQVIVNLVINASESIPSERAGTIAVRTFAQEFTEDTPPPVRTVPNELTPGRYVVLEVRDSGIGMTQETIAKIFDPFFTTKFTGRGLGLAAVQGVARTMKGSIAVESAPGSGSNLRIFFPAGQAPLVPEKAPAWSTTAFQQGSPGTILVIDDEENVRYIIRAALERAGYKVVLAGGGATGLQLLEKHHAAISLVLLDMSMPEIGGKEVLAKMRASKIAIPVVVCSGYSEAEVLRQFAGFEFTAFIQKPFRLKDLPERIGQVLRPLRTGARLS